MQRLVPGVVLAAVLAAMATAEVQKRLTNDGAEAAPGTPEDYAAHIDRDEKRWSAVVRASGATGK